jgi:hypothetical protein
MSTNNNIIGLAVPLKNPLAKKEIDEHIKLLHGNPKANSFATGYLYGLVAANNGVPIKAERLREVYQATLDYLGITNE